jgi:hypothetical protein
MPALCVFICVCVCVSVCVCVCARASLMECLPVCATKCAIRISAISMLSAMQPQIASTCVSNYMHARERACVRMDKKRERESV